MDGVQASKQNSNPIELKMNALFIMSGRNKGRGRTFTDASKEGKTCGIGVYIDSIKRHYSVRLTQEVSITSAELIAIRLAVAQIEEYQLHNQVIYTDSKSACMMLESAQESREDESILVEILHTCHRWNIAIQWIPSHIGIYGNEIADQLARNGLTSDVVMENNILLQDAMFLLKHSLNEKTEEWYADYSREKGRNFFTIQPSFNSKPWFKGVDLKGHVVKLMNRLMAGHDYSKFWLARMKIESNPDCDICDVPETAEHLILHCPRFGILRMKYTFDNKYRTLSDMLQTKNPDLFQEVADFLTAARLKL